MAIRSASGREFRPSTPSPETLTFKDRLGALKNLPAFFRMVWEASPSLFLANAFLRLVRSAIPLLILYVGKLIIDEVLHQTQLIGTHELNYLWTLLVFELLLAIVSDGLGRAVALIDSLLGDLFANRSSVQIMEHAATLDLEQFEDAAFYDKLERARQQTVGRTVLLSQVLGQAQDFITMLFLAAGLISFNPWLIVLLLVAVIPAFLGENYFNEQSYSLVRNWTPERRELDYLRYMGASDESAKEVKIFGLSDFLIARFRKLSHEFYLKNRSLSIRRASWGVLFSGVGTVGYYGAYAYILWQTVSGKLSIGDLTFLAGSFRQLRALLEGILSRFSSVSQGALYLQDLFEYFAIRPNIFSGKPSLPFPKPIREGFVFENVGFKYQNAERWANRHLNFTLQPGEKLALVGENGAGKTTLVKLLARLYDPTEGRILLDGHDLRDYNLTDLRENVGVIFQDYVRFKMTASTNIAIGKIAEQANQPRIEQAAQRSLADSVIEKLPAGYDQMLGRSFGRGIELSGGEWQKVALGRAYMRDAQVLILDEPTAALDARAEYEVFQRFAELTTGKTAILISHRFSTVRMADRILVLENGELVEMGSHEELLAQNTRYAELFRLQAKGYQ